MLLREKKLFIFCISAISLCLGALAVHSISAPDTAGPRRAVEGLSRAAARNDETAMADYFGGRRGELLRAISPPRRRYQAMARRLDAAVTARGWASIDEFAAGGRRTFAAEPIRIIDVSRQGDSAVARVAVGRPGGKSQIKTYDVRREDGRWRLFPRDETREPIPDQAEQDRIVRAFTDLADAAERLAAGVQSGKITAERDLRRAERAALARAGQIIRGEPTDGGR